MRRLHLWVGVLTVLAFLATGQFMRHHEPPMTAFRESVRLMFRSRHIYILSSGLVNLMLGVYFQAQVAGWKRRVQLAGSGLVMAAPLALILAFVVEPGRDFHAEMWRSHAGLYALFAGCMLHFVSAKGGNGS